MELNEVWATRGGGSLLTAIGYAAEVNQTSDYLDAIETFVSPTDVAYWTRAPYPGMVDWLVLAQDNKAPFTVRWSRAAPNDPRCETFYRTSRYWPKDYCVAQEAIPRRTAKHRYSSIDFIRVTQSGYMLVAVFRLDAGPNTMPLATGRFIRHYPGEFGRNLSKNRLFRGKNP